VILAIITTLIMVFRFLNTTVISISGIRTTTTVIIVTYKPLKIIVIVILAIITTLIMVFRFLNTTVISISGISTHKFVNMFCTLYTLNN